MNSLIDLELTTLKFENKNIKINIKGFILYYNKHIYIITIHHNYPVEKIKYNSLDLDIIVNSNWSEVLILQSKLNLDYKIYTKYNISLPKINTFLNMNNLELKVIDYEFLNYDNLDNSPRIPYIKCIIINYKQENIKYKLFLGSSGTPVFYNNKIIGVFSKFDQQDNHLYILPIYIFLKNINKRDNNNLYSIKDLSNITKIDKYYIYNNNIYHPNLKYYIPIDSFFLLEGDINKSFTIELNDNSIIKITNELLKNNNNDIIKYIFEENIYNVNYRLLRLLLEIDKTKLFNIFDHVNKYKLLENDLYLFISNNEIIFIN